VSERPSVGFVTETTDEAGRLVSVVDR